MKFLQISDTHFLEDYRQNHDLFEMAFLNMTSPLEKIRKIKKELGDTALDFLVHCGDMCHSGGKGDYLALKEALEEMFPSLPMVVTCGNRDDKTLLQEVFYGGTGDFLYAHDVGDLRVISYNNANETPQGELTEEMCVLLWEELEKNPQKPTILVCHHHCISNQIPSMKAVDCPPLFEKIVGHSSVLALLTGHTHHGFQGEYGGKPCYTVPPLSFVAKATETGQDVYEAGGYHLFSYEKGCLTLEKAGDLSYHEKIGQTN